MRSAPNDLSINAARASAPFAEPLQRPINPAHGRSGGRSPRSSAYVACGAAPLQIEAAVTGAPSTREDGAGGAAGGLACYRSNPCDPII
jgi:hypothetical protein